MALATPSRVVGTYFTLWGGGLRITSVPKEVNLIYLFHAVPAGGGAFRFEYGNAVSAAEIKTCRDRGQRVVLTVGGANAGWNFRSRAESDAFVRSFIAMVDGLGGQIDGCDFNNFEAGIGSNPAEMVYISQQLKNKYGAEFSITCPPHPGAGYAPMDRTLTKAMAEAGVLTYAGPQFYDSQDLTQAGTIIALIREWCQHLGDPRKVVIGLSANYGAGPSLDTCKAVWTQLVKEFPSLRGVFAWSAQDDAGGNWNWAKAMGPLVGSAPAAPTDPAKPTEPTSPTTPTTPTTPMNTYTVVSGDTLNAISTRTGVSVANLVTWNKIADPNTIEVGDVLVLKAPSTKPVVGDRVRVERPTSTYHNATGEILSISGTKAQVRLDNGRNFELSWLRKI